MSIFKQSSNKVVQKSKTNADSWAKNVLTRFGLACCVLPYFGEWREWHLVMNLACSQTRAEWQKHRRGFEGLFRMVTWRTDKAEIEALFQQKCNAAISLDAGANLLLIASNPADLSFVSAAKELRFPKMNKLEIWKAEQMHMIFLKSMCRFLQTSSRNKLNEFVLNWDAHLDLAYIKEGIPYIIKNTLRTVRLETVSINQKILQLIFNSLEDVQELVLINCKIEIASEFTVDSSKWRRLAVLDLRRSLKKDQPHLATANSSFSQAAHSHQASVPAESSLRFLLRSLSKTPIKDNLIKLQLSEGEFQRSEVQSLLWELDFKLAQFY